MRLLKYGIYFLPKQLLCIYLGDYVSSALDKVNVLARGCNRCLIISGACVIETSSNFLKELRSSQFGLQMNPLLLKYKNLCNIQSPEIL